MTEKLSFFDNVSVDQRSPRPLHMQVYDAIRCAILDGQLRAGLRLPSTRTFASELGISRNTMVAAYEQLTSEGYLESLVGSGTRVSTFRLVVESVSTKTGADVKKNDKFERRSSGISDQGKRFVNTPRHLPTYEKILPLRQACRRSRSFHAGNGPVLWGGMRANFRRNTATILIWRVFPNSAE